MKNNELKLLNARVCYGHLGGTLGERLFQKMVELEWFAPVEHKATVYEITETGVKELEKLGVDIYNHR